MGTLISLVEWVGHLPLVSNIAHSWGYLNAHYDKELDCPSSQVFLSCLG
jgi:hypothetical protein